MATEKVIVEVDVNSESAEKNLQGIDEGAKEAKGSVSGLKEGILGSVPALGKLKTAFRGLNSALGIIGLVVAGIVALKEAFTSSEAGANKYNKLLAVIGSVFDNIVEVTSVLATDIVDLFENPKQSLNDFGKLIKENITNRFDGLVELIPQLSKAIDLLFSGEFSAAGEVAFNAVTKVTLGVENMTDVISGGIDAIKEFGEEVVADANKAAEISDTRANLAILERQLLIDRAKAQRDISEARAISADKDNVLVADRIAALEKASEIEQAITEREIQAAALRLQAKKEENALANSTTEDLLEQAQLEADLINLQTQSANQQKLLIAEITTAKREAAEEEAQIEREKSDAILAENKRLADEQKRLADKKKRADALAAQNEIQKEQQVAAAKKQIGQTTLSALQSLGTEGTKFSKAVAVTDVGISTIKGAIGAFQQGMAAYPAPYGAIVGGVAAAATAAAGAVAIKKIVSTSNTPSASGISSSSAVPSAPVNQNVGDVAPPSFNVQGDGVNQGITDAMSNGTVKAYVVESDIKTSAEMNRRTKSQSTL